MATTTGTECTVCDDHDEHVLDEHHAVACYRRTTETIEVIHHGRGFLVRMIGGKWHDAEIHCSTEDSAMNLFNRIVAARNADRDIEWLHPVVVDEND